MNRLTDQMATASAIEAYANHVRELGYKGEEVTLLIIGFEVGWRHALEAVQRLADALDMEAS